MLIAMRPGLVELRGKHPHNATRADTGATLARLTGNRAGCSQPDVTIGWSAGREVWDE